MELFELFRKPLDKLKLFALSHAGESLELVELCEVCREKGDSHVLHPLDPARSLDNELLLAAASLDPKRSFEPLLTKTSLSPARSLEAFLSAISSSWGLSEF